MDSILEVIRDVPQVDPLIFLATGGAVLAAGSLAWGAWQERKRKQMGAAVVAANQRLYSMQAIRASMGRLIKETVLELVNKEQMSADDADKVCTALAFKLGNWELHPKPKGCTIPDPVQVKTVIRARLNGRHTQVLPFPDLPVPHKASSLADELRTLLGTR